VRSVTNPHGKECIMARERERISLAGVNQTGCRQARVIWG